MCITKFTMWKVECTACGLQSTFCCAQYAVNTVQCTVYIVQYAVYNVQCTGNSVKCILYSLHHVFEQLTGLSRHIGINAVTYMVARDPIKWIKRMYIG